MTCPMKMSMSTKTTKAKTTRSDAQTAFIHNIASARELITMLTRHLDDHMGVGPDEVHWGHVGDAGRLVENLKEAAVGCNLIPEATSILVLRNIRW